MLIRAHFDGRTIVPDEPVELPSNTALNVRIEPSALWSQESDRPPAPDDFAERKWPMAELRNSIPGVKLPAHISRADNFYDERESLRDGFVLSHR